MAKKAEKSKQAEKTKSYASKVEEFIFLSALENAIKFRGKANPGAILGRVLGKFEEYRTDTKKAMQMINKVVADVNKMSLEEQETEIKNISPDFFEKEKEKKKERKEERLELPDLPDAVDGKVVMRLAPFPSGAMHIGNTKTYMLNAMYAEKYHGKILFVMDDTIGSEQKQLVKEAFTLIPEAFKWLGVKYEEPIYYKSDRLELYYKYAEELIKKGSAYVCYCDVEKLRENRALGNACEHRKQTPEQAMDEWKKMFTAKEGAALLRLKTDIKHKNPAFRDRGLFRISERDHPKVGKKYRVWPMLEFSWAIDDHFLGITHILRGKELMIESEMEKFIWKIFKWPSPVLMHVGLVRLEGMGAKISKSKAQAEVKSGKFFGWDDPRTWSVQSLRRRGILPEAIRNFIKELGVNQNDIVVPIDSLYSINKKMIDPISKRFFFIEHPVKINVNGAQKEEAKLQILPSDEKHSRKIKCDKEFYIEQRDFDDIKEGDVFRLMGLFNVKRDVHGFKFHSKELDQKITSKYIHWLPADKENEKSNVKIKMLMPDGSMIAGIAESNIKDIEENEVVQFERFAFARLDNKKDWTFWLTHK